MGNEAMSEDQWGRSPKFYLRADAIGALTRRWRPASFLEIGAGTGEMTSEFIKRGYHGKIYDLGEQTRAGLRTRFDDNAGVTVVDAVEEVTVASADYLLAFEVLEHIEDDRAALSAWTTKLKRGGRLLISVPAHQHKYSQTDRRVGHVRRYEREQLRTLIADCGYSRIDIACYGFPLGNIGRIVGNLLEPQTGASTDTSAVERSIDSGTRQSSAVMRLSRMMRPWMLWPFFLAQRLTFTLDIGDGYVVRAVRSN